VWYSVASCASFARRVFPSRWATAGRTPEDVAVERLVDQHVAPFACSTTLALFRVSPETTTARPL
jgi:hypothetical protein